ncbi:MAG: hypothetical protein GY908_02265 [Flavobacteriales bacterium]|nr:hypothetical protein [Flavobacteriales bacterium]
MIANFFNQTKPINFLLLSILVFFIYLVALINVDSAPLNFFFFAKNSLFIFLAILSVFVINFIIRKNALTEDNSFAILFYILMSSYFPNSYINDGLFISNFILLFAFRRIYSLRSSIETKEKIFDSAFWIGIASLFYVWSLFYLLLVYAAILIFRKIEWRNFVVPILGVLTPVFLSYTYLLAFDDLERFNNLWKLSFDLNFQAYNSYHYMIPLALIGILSIIAIVPTTKRSLLAKIDFKATWTLLIAHILISVIVVMFAPEKNGAELIFLFFPLSVLFANYVQVINRYWVKELIIYIFILMILNNLI